MEEERRLCYVGMTRARRNLYLVRTFRRTLFGSSDTREPSRFLGDIPSELIEGAPVRVAVSRGSGRWASPPMTREERRKLISRRRASVQQAMARRTALEAPDGAGARRDLARGGNRGASRARAGEDAPNREGRLVEISFHPGESVVHPIFGLGTVISSKLVDDDEEVTVAFEGRGVKRLMASYAKLQKS